MLYEVLPNAPRASIDPPKPTSGPHVDGVIGFIFNSMKQFYAQLGKLIVTSQAPIIAYRSTNSSSFKQSTEILTMNSTVPKKNQQLGGKRNNKKNKQRNQTSQDSQQNPQNQGGSTSEHYRKIKFPCKSHSEHITHEFPHMDEVHRFLTPPKSTQKPVVLTHAFPSQPQRKMVAQPPPPPQGGNKGPLFNPTNSSYVITCKEDVNVTVGSKSYDVPELSYSPKDSLAPPTSTRPLTLDRSVELVYRPLKGVFHKETHNPSVWTAQHYSIVEYLSHYPYDMSSLEVLQNCPQ